MAQSKILRGTMLLSGASFLSKFLGMIYVIPFHALVGATGGTLFAYAYTPYSILISLSTMGVPLAVSKFVSKYNTLGDYETGRRMYRSGLKLMGLSGIIAFLLLFFGAELLAPIIKGDNAKGNTQEDIAMVIQMVSFALLVIPAMSITRGFFQGYESMGPTAVSQVVEQIVRIAFLLIASYYVMETVGDIRLAVGFASFAAFIGAIASAIVLYVYWRRRRHYLDQRLDEQTVHYDIDLKDIYKEMFSYAGPFVLVGIAIPLLQFIDMLTFNRSMSLAGFTDEFNDIAYGAIHLFGHKLVIIPVTLATGLSLALLPTMTRSFNENNRKQLFQQINQALQIVMLLVLPASIGISLLSNEAYTTFYNSEHIQVTGSLLGWYAPVALIFALFTVTSSMLQGINEQKFATVSLGVGVLLKVVLNIPLILWLGAYGSVIGTGIAMGGAVALNLYKIRTSVAFPMKQFVKRSALIGIITILMSLLVLILRWLLGIAGLEYTNGKLSAVLVLFICAGAGGLFYLWAAYQTTLLERILGNRIKGLDRFLKRKES